MEWRPLEEFPDYSVSDQGDVRSDRYDRLRKSSMTNGGVTKVTIFKDGRAHTRSVGLLVAKAFVWNDYDPGVFNTPIHLNNDMSDNRAVNLAWRPRWFALKYQRQYFLEAFRFATTKVIDIDTGICYPNLVEPCQEFGLLYVDLLRACENNTYVFPTWKEFTYGPND